MANVNSFSTVRICIYLLCNDLQIRKPGVAPQIDFLGVAVPMASAQSISCTVGGTATPTL
jgi:hypothetical protein